MRILLSRVSTDLRRSGSPDALLRTTSALVGDAPQNWPRDPGAGQKGHRPLRTEWAGQASGGWGGTSEGHDVRAWCQKTDRATSLEEGKMMTREILFAVFYCHLWTINLSYWVSGLVDQVVQVLGLLTWTFLERICWKFVQLKRLSFWWTFGMFESFRIFNRLLIYSFRVFFISGIR